MPDPPMPDDAIAIPLQIQISKSSIERICVRMIARLRADASIYSYNCARPFFVHRLHWPFDEIESATNLEASERIDRARDGDDALARWPDRPQVAINPIGKEATLSRLLAHSRLAASAHTIGSSRHHQHCTFLARRADDGRMRDRPNNASPHACPRPASLPPALPSPTIKKTSARARAGGQPSIGVVCVPPIPCASISAHYRPHFPARRRHRRRIGWLSTSPRAHARLRHPRIPPSIPPHSPRQTQQTQTDGARTNRPPAFAGRPFAEAAGAPGGRRIGRAARVRQPRPARGAAARGGGGGSTWSRRRRRCRKAESAASPILVITTFPRTARS